MDMLIEMIEKKRKANGMRMADAARALGVPSQNYNNWVYRGSLPKRYIDAAKKFIEGENNESILHKDVFKKIMPVLEWTQVADFIAGSIDEDQITNHITCPVDCSDGFALKVTGDSMTATHPGERSYPDGTIIFIDSYKNVTPGARVVALLDNGQATFKTFTEDSGKRFLMPINTRYQTIEMNDQMSICGVVVAAMTIE